MADVFDLPQCLQATFCRIAVGTTRTGKPSMLKQIRIAILSLLLVLAVAVLVVSHPTSFSFITGYPSWQVYIDSQSRRLLVGAIAQAKQEISIPIQALAEFDFKTKQSILELRTALVLQYPELIGEEYEPSEVAFGQIVDGLPWWGMHGIYFYGPGKRSIEGMSEESRFLLNPYLLVGVLEDRAWINRLVPENFEQYFPQPISLEYQPAESIAIAHYNVSGFFNHLKQHAYPQHQSSRVSLVAYNARDFGYNFLYIDPAQSNGLDTEGRTKEPVPIYHYIHQGGSCRYPKGCNNGSPYQPGMIVRVLQLPAKMHIKLWKQRPVELTAEADMNFVIRMN